MMIISMTRERGSVYQSSEYASRIADEAKAWSRYALKHSALSPARVHNAAIEAVSFSFEHRTHQLAIPTKLSGTRVHQENLERLHNNGPSRWAELDLVSLDGRIEVYWRALRLGWIWEGHAWLWPLLTVGVKARLLAVTGTDANWKWLGCNLVLTGVAEAINALKPPTARPAAPVRHPDFINQPTTNGVAR